VTRRVLVVAVISALIGSSGAFGGDCPSVCPGECSVMSAFWANVKAPEIGITTMRCLQARCDLRPWCFEVFTTLNVLGLTSRRRVFGGSVSETTQDFLGGMGVKAEVRGGVATVCVPFGYEVPIVIPGRGGEAAVFRVPVGRIDGGCVHGKVLL